MNSNVSIRQFEQYLTLIIIIIILIIIMTVVVQTRDRCRICYSLLLRDRSICCQKSYNLFKHIERRKIPLNKLNSYQIKIRNQTVCFRDLVLRYLHTQIQQTRNYSNLICSDCSMILLDIEQCAKYLRKTINQLKVKLNKTTRLQTSSLSATFQKKKHPSIKQEQLPIINSDSDEEFDDIDDEEEFDDEQDEIKPTNNNNNNNKSSNQSPSSSSIGDSSTSNNHLNNNRPCNDDDDDEDGLIKSSPKKSQQQNLSEFFHRLQTNPINSLSGSNGLMTRNLLDETNPNLMQLRLAHMMASAAAANSGLNLNDNMDSMMNIFANMQRNFALQFLSDPMAAAQATQAAATAAAASATHIKGNIPSMSSNNKQISSGRKRKSTPEKRVISNHRSANNNGDVRFILPFYVYQYFYLDISNN